jgi:formylglycine-generating enzyme required for sulfatase activity
VGSDGKFADMSHPATISEFQLGKYEVTVGRFRAFTQTGYTVSNPPDDGAGAHEAIPTSGWSSAWNMYLGENTGDWSGLTYRDDNRT